MTARSAAGAALWSVLAAIVLAGAWLFLRACALDALGLDFCPAPANRATLRRAVAEGDALAREVHAAELAAAEAPTCSPAGPAPANPSPSRTETEAIDRKVVERGGRNGRLQFTLEWATPDDLDLNVDCPGGRIDATAGHAGPGICGDGRKDVDANRNLVENVSATPIENVVWQTDVPPGPYRIEIIEFRSAGSDGNSVPFTLRLRWNGEERVCHDAVTSLPLRPEQVADGRVLGGTEKLMTWQSGDPLPDCTFVTADTFRGAPPK